MGSLRERLITEPKKHVMVDFNPLRSFYDPKQPFRRKARLDASPGRGPRVKATPERIVPRRASDNTAK